MPRRWLCADTIDFLSHFNNTLNSPSTPLRPGTHACPSSFHPHPIVAPVPLPLPPWVHECGSPSVLFDCHSLAWVHGKPAVYFLTLTGYLCRHPTPVQPPPGFVCRRDNDTPRNDTLRNHGVRTTHCATTVRGRLMARLTAQPPCEDDSRRATTARLTAQPPCEDNSRRATTARGQLTSRLTQCNHGARTTHGARTRRTTK